MRVLLVVLLLSGCASLDEAHRGILLRRIRTMGELAASLEPDPRNATIDRAEAARLASDVDAHLR